MVIGCKRCHLSFTLFFAREKKPLKTKENFNDISMHIETNCKVKLYHAVPFVIYRIIYIRLQFSNRAIEHQLRGEQMATD